MKIVRTSAVAALALAGGMFGGNVAVAGQQREPAVVADELLTRAVHAERSYRERLVRLQRLRDRADEQGETDRVAEFDALSERSRVEHARKVKRMRGRMGREMLERFDAEVARDHPGRGLALGHEIGNRGEAAGKAELRQELRDGLRQALAKRHAVQYRQARIDDYLGQWKQRAQDRREHRRDASRERRQDRREARHDRRQDHREARKDRRQDRREARHDRRQDRRETKKNHRRGHREARKDDRRDRRETKRGHHKRRREAKRDYREGHRDAKRGREDRRDRAGNRAQKRSDHTLRRRGKPHLRPKNTPRTPTRRRPDEE